MEAPVCKVFVPTSFPGNKKPRSLRRSEWRLESRVRLKEKYPLQQQENFLPSGLYRRPRNFTGSVRTLRWKFSRYEVAGYTAGREFTQHLFSCIIFDHCKWLPYKKIGAGLSPNPENLKIMIYFFSSPVNKRLYRCLLYHRGNCGYGHFFCFVLLFSQYRGSGQTAGKDYKIVMRPDKH